MNGSELLQLCNEYLDYNQETGDLTWVKKASKNTIIGSTAGYTRPSKYMTVKLNKNVYLAHRLIFFMVEGYWPKYVDHINNIRNDNRWCNLRECTHSQNHMNKGIQSNNSSGYIGVSHGRLRKKWRARIKVNGKETNLGTFTTKLLAAKAYNDAAIKMHGEFARLNKV